LSPIRAYCRSDLARASELERQRNWRGLLEFGESWTRASPDQCQCAWFVLGRAYSKLQRNPEAVAAYRQALKLDSGDVGALINLGNLYRELNLWREAVKVYRDALQIAPNSLQAWHNLGQTFYVLKGAAGVGAALQRLGASDPELAEAWRKLIIEYSISRNPLVAQKAIAVLSGLNAEDRRRMFDILFAER
jgi:tetratricopeptide (TPR) repeat protein